MEKYAIDIDKVLDEFEEKEALTTDVDGSEEPKRHLRNVSDSYSVPSYFDEKLPANFKQKENLLPLPTSTKHEHENPKCETLDNSLIFTNDDHTLSENSSLPSSKTEFASKTEISDCNNELNISITQKRNLKCTTDCNSKHLNCGIGFETISENSYKNFDTSSCPVKECSSKPKICEKNDCSEEALCTSSKEIGADLEKLIKLPLENLKNFNIKQEFEPENLSEPAKMTGLEDGNSFVSHDTEPDLTTSTFKGNNNTTNQKFFEISEKNLSTNVSDKNICKESAEINAVQKFSLDFREDNKDAEQSSVDTSEHSFDYINNLCSNASVINGNSTSLNFNKLCTETNCHIETFVSNCHDSELNQNNVEPLLLNNVSGNLPDTLPFKFPSVQVPDSWKITNGTDVFDSKVSSNFSQDDDSGVSSQEDISSNSPSELPPNRSSNSTNKKNYICHKATISKLMSHQNGTSEGFDKLTTIETPVTFIEDTNQDVETSKSQCDKLEFVHPIVDEKNCIKISQDIKSDIELDSPLNNNQNTSFNVSLLESSELVMPSSETNNCTESFQDAENPVCVPPFSIHPDIKEKTLLSETFDSGQSSNSTANKTNSEVFVGNRHKLDLPDSDIIDNDSEYAEKFKCEVRNDTLLCKHVPSDNLNQDVEILSNSNHNNFENDCHASEIASKFSEGLECEQIDICERSVEESINSEKIVADDETNHCEVSPRLQRPTSLNLPSLQFQSSELPDESEFNGCSEEQHIEENISSIIPVDAPNVGNTCIKQQQQIGFIKPYWIPDGEAFNCMHCALKFTVIRRRHHCRACGKVLCSRCCNQRAYLAYMNKEDRICQPCAEVLSSNNTLALLNEQLPTSINSPSSSSCGSSPNFSPAPQVSSVSIEEKTVWRPHPNNPDDYCSTIPPLQQMELSGQKPPPTVMVPIGVLKRGNKRRREPKQVIFSDGIRPGGDLTDLTEPMETAPVYRRTGRKRVDKIFSENSKETSTISSVRGQQKFRQKRFLVSDEDGPLPPIMLPQDHSSEDTVEWSYILQLLLDEDQKPVKFSLMKNLHILVKLTKLDCCFGKECWCFTSDGFCSVGQDEVMIILERIPNEAKIPRDMFKIFTHIYDNASKGSIIEELGHTIFTDEILGSSDHRGFLFVRPSFQCLSKLTVPTTPYLVAILIHKWEVPWAKVFPLRLMLRMGAECRYYPCSLVSVRNRKPIFFEIGQTIMNVLADLRNYQFTIPVVPGLVVHMEEKKTYVNIPRNRYEKVMKVLKSNNVEHVLALGSNFSSEADSHLVCMQKEEGDYQTQAINIENTTRRVTGASFIVFSGALKSTSGLTAKFSIVEDGLLIQISQETMMALHVALRDMKDLTIECGHVGASEPDEIVIIQWTRDDKKFNLGVRSPIDGKSFEGISNLRIHTSTDYAGENYLIRWTEVFFLDVEENGNSIQNELVDPCRLAETVAQSCCMALTPFLDQLAEADLLKIGLRVTLDTEKDRVGYDIGARGKMLPSAYMTALDNSLIPVILRLSNITQKEKLSFELIFHILIK